MERRNLTQVEVSRRSGIDKYTISDVLNDRRDPQFETVRKLVAAIDTSWAELFDEPGLILSAEEAESVRASRDVLDRLLAQNAAQNAIAAPPAPVQPQRSRRRPPVSPPSAPATMVRDSGLGGVDEVQSSAEPIPEWYYRAGARRAFTVTTDSMTGAGILEGATVYVRMTLDRSAADGRIVVCTLNATWYLKRLDLRGGQTTLESANPGYPTLTVTEADEFSLFGIVVMKPE